MLADPLARAHHNQAWRRRTEEYLLAAKPHCARTRHRGLSRLAAFGGNPACRYPPARMGRDLCLASGQQATLPAAPSASIAGDSLLPRSICRSSRIAEGLRSPASPWLACRCRETADRITLTGFDGAAFLVAGCQLSFGLTRTARRGATPVAGE